MRLVPRLIASTLFLFIQPALAEMGETVTITLIDVIQLDLNESRIKDQIKGLYQITSPFFV